MSLRRRGVMRYHELTAKIKPKTKTNNPISNLDRWKVVCCCNGRVFVHFFLRMPVIEEIISDSNQVTLLTVESESPTRTHLELIGKEDNSFPSRLSSHERIISHG
jgi:hypothetical protein